MHDAHGVGLAATQVGVLRRVFVFQRGEDDVVAVVNPALVDAATRRRPTTKAASRSRAYACRSSGHCASTLEGKDATGDDSARARGHAARVVQHELDHLDGVLIIDRTTPEARKRGARGAAAAADPRAELSVRIAVAATAPFGADVLERLAGAPRDRVPARRGPTRRAAAAARLGAPPAKEAAERLGIPVLQPERPELDGRRRRRSSSRAYGLLIPDALLEQALWLNVHPSLLPRWRGAAPGRARDHGRRPRDRRDDPRDGQGARRGADRRAGGVPDRDEDDAGAVFARAAELAAELLDDVLAASRAFEPQPEDGVTYAEKITPADRELDLADPRAAVRVVRALSPHIGARASCTAAR